MDCARVDLWAIFQASREARAGSLKNGRCFGGKAFNATLNNAASSRILGGVQRNGPMGVVSPSGGSEVLWTTPER